MASTGTYRNAKPSLKFKQTAPPSTAAVRRSSPASIAATSKDDAGVPGRVRVAVRLRPRNAEELVADADFADCVELEPELKRLKLRKNNWDADTYEFDEVLTEFASQKRVYEVVAKPVVESVLEGYNGTIMAYGQTGTGKTFTLGRLGEENTADRGIMVRSMEDILSDIYLQTDSVSVSYLQLYMETIQDLLDPGNDNISIVEDPKTGDVFVPGATLVEIRDQQSFVELLHVGEAHRYAANTKLNTESSRSHAILMVHIRRSVNGKNDREVPLSSENGNASHLIKPLRPTIVRKSKLVVVDLAGSERIDKSGSEGHTLEEAKSINLSLSALGKCINALAEDSAHVPVRDSKLTRLLRDSFGGTARTSLVITIGPSPRHRGETSSTIMFGQRAMKVQNMLKLKEEFDYKSSARRLGIELDKITAENERWKKAFEDEKERRLEAENRIFEAENGYTKALEATENAEFLKLRKMLEDGARQKQKLEEEITILKTQLLQLNIEADKTRTLNRGGSGQVLNGLDSFMNQVRHPQVEDSANGQKASVAKLFEQEYVNFAVGLQKILSLLESKDAEVRIHAVITIANLAAEEANQEKIVEVGGLSSLFMLLKCSEDETIRRTAAAAVANLAMNETNQELIMAQGGINLLSITAAGAEDPKTLLMVAGALANLCENDKLQTKLRGEGGIKALLGMVRCGHPYILAQVARGIANFAKCESRSSSQGTKTRKSFLIEDGALPWIVQNATNEASTIRRQIELALCHLAQREVNAKDMISGGALLELVRISQECSREDIRTLAHMTLISSATFRTELQRLRIEL